MSTRRVHFENPAYSATPEPEDEVEEIFSESSAKFTDASVYEDEEVSADDVSYMSIYANAGECLDVQGLNARKNIEYSRYQIRGRAESLKFASEGDFGALPIASLEEVPCAEECLISPSSLNEKSTGLINEEGLSQAACSALLSYFIDLRRENEFVLFDYHYVANLITGEGAADINFTDEHGQTIMHEVAREWNTDIANFLMTYGANIDQPDLYGRTPLYVAVASNFLEMAQWLLDNGADLHHRTYEKEFQTVFHYAAKFGYTEMLTFLMDRGADVRAVDNEYRNALHLAADWSRDDACRLLLSIGLPAGSYSTTGEYCLTQIIMKTSNSIGVEALDQFKWLNHARKKTTYYLGHLGERRWKKLNMARGIAGATSAGLPKSPLEAIVDSNNLTLIRHPVILQLLTKKAEQYGRLCQWRSLLGYLLFIIISTVSITFMKDLKPRKYDWVFYSTLIMTVIGQAQALYYMAWLYIDIQRSTRQLSDHKEYTLRQLKEQKAACHPRWECEKMKIKKEKEGVRYLSTKPWTDPWLIMELLALFLYTLHTVLYTLHMALPNNSRVKEVRMYYSCVLLVVLWLSINKSLVSFQHLGPFIHIFASAMNTVVQFAFLFFDFFIPFVCGIWLVFGKEREDTGDETFSKLHSTIYEVFLATLVYDYNFDAMFEIDAAMARIFASLYLLLVSCVAINLYIALLAETFVRVHAHAAASASLSEAKMYLTLERTYPHVKEQFEEYLFKQCSPLVIEGLHDTSRIMGLKQTVNHATTVIDTVRRSLKATENEIMHTKESIYNSQKQIDKYKAAHLEQKVELKDTMESMGDILQSYLPPLLYRKLRRLKEDSISFAGLWSDE